MEQFVRTNSYLEAASRALEHEEAFVALIPAIPLLGVLVLVLLIGARQQKHWLAGWIATFFALSSFMISGVLFSALLDGIDALVITLWPWFEVGSLEVTAALRFDRLSGVMALVVTGVGSLIHLYSIGYMEEDQNNPRFFCYLNLFLFAMLLLVLGDNLVVMFVGWEGVGLCSYLLIGFWYEEMSNAEAGQKAFVVNRIGDAGFLLGIFTLFWASGTVAFPGLREEVPYLPEWIIETSALLLFVGAVGKSAQLPLYVWLPDAMAGPTPVSALIHAATMVTAGVYMVTRLSFLYASAPIALTVLLVVGACTALFAATIALAQNDIKKVLAYSTVSQLGFMVMALGAGAFSFGIFHLVTHAFFKALLFMAAGSVIIGCHHEQDMRRFGGLWWPMVSTFLAYLFGSYVIAGLPGGSGAYSKDGILWAVYSSDTGSEVFGFALGKVAWAVGIAAASLTAFYITRSLMLTFFGTYRGKHKPHESPWTMLVPLAVLAALSAAFGWARGEELLTFLGDWTRSDLMVSHEELMKNETYVLLERIVMAVGASGVLLAVLCYCVGERAMEWLRETAPFSWINTALVNKWWVDELYSWLIIKPLRAASGFLFHVVDVLIIDGIVNGAGVFALANGELARRVETGRLGTYALVMFTGLLAGLLFWVLLA